MLKDASSVSIRSEMKRVSTVPTGIGTKRPRFGQHTEATLGVDDDESLLVLPSGSPRSRPRRRNGAARRAGRRRSQRRPAREALEHSVRDRGVGGCGTCSISRLKDAAQRGIPRCATTDESLSSDAMASSTTTGRWSLLPAVFDSAVARP